MLVPARAGGRGAGRRAAPGRWPAAAPGWSPRPWPGQPGNRWPGGCGRWGGCRGGVAAGPGRGAGAGAGGGAWPGWRARWRWCRRWATPRVEAPLWVLTCGAVAAGPDATVTSPAQAMALGLGRVADLEHPGRWGGLADVPAVLDERAGRRLCAVLAGNGEDQVAIRGTGTLARRLVPRRAAPASGPPVGAAGHRSDHRRGPRRRPLPGRVVSPAGCAAGGVRRPVRPGRGRHRRDGRVAGRCGWTWPWWPATGGPRRR